MDREFSELEMILEEEESVEPNIERPGYMENFDKKYFVSPEQLEIREAIEKASERRGLEDPLEPTENRYVSEANKFEVANAIYTLKADALLNKTMDGE